MERSTIMGIVSIILGIIILACPLAGFLAINWIFAISILLVGIFAVISGATGKTNWATIVLGILVIILGLCLFYPVTFRLFVAFINYLTGIVLILFAIVNLFADTGYNKYMSISALIFGIISLIFGYCVSIELFGAIFIALVIGIWFIISGFMGIFLPKGE